MDEHEARAQRNASADRVHGAEQEWAATQQRLNQIIDAVRAAETAVYTNAAGNTDGSVLFDWLKGFVRSAEAGSIDKPNAHHTTRVLLAAALTRLVRDDRTDAILADLEKEINNK